MLWLKNRLKCAWETNICIRHKILGWAFHVTNVNTKVNCLILMMAFLMMKILCFICCWLYLALNDLAWYYNHRCALKQQWNFGSLSSMESHFFAHTQHDYKQKLVPHIVINHHNSIHLCRFHHGAGDQYFTDGMHDPSHVYYIGRLSSNSNRICCVCVHGCTHDCTCGLLLTLI